MEMILENLKGQGIRESTTRNYYGIWKAFNKFLIRLDRKPATWEQRTTLYIAYLINNGIQSATIKSYLSAIKNILTTDGYSWHDNSILVTSLTRACKLVNDHVKTRLPILVGLLEIPLFELQRTFYNQPYLQTLYKCILAIGYYGMVRIGELTLGSHSIKAKDVYIGQNKNKILIVLYTSKTHGVYANPQQIKIKAAMDYKRKYTGTSVLLI